MAGRKEKPATPAQIAAAEFEPIPMNLDWLPTPEQLLNPHGVSVRMAMTVLSKTKAELIEVVRGLGGDQDDGGDLAPIVQGLQESQRFYEEAAAMLESAETRLMVAAHATVDWTNEGGAADLVTPGAEVQA